MGLWMVETGSRMVRSVGVDPGAVSGQGGSGQSGSGQGRRTDDGGNSRRRWPCRRRPLLYSQGRLKVVMSPTRVLDDRAAPGSEIAASELAGSETARIGDG